MFAVRSILFDVDDVLIEMDEATLAAEEALVAPLSLDLPATVARAVKDGLVNGYALLRAQLRAPPGALAPGFAELRARIETWQRGVLEDGHELKLWSRDTLLAIALEDQGAPVEAARLERALAAYWGTMAARGSLFPDAKSLLLALGSRGIKFHLATNSDGFLRFDAAARTFRYDPIDASRRKRLRLGALIEAGVRPEQITIGDPIGKPSPRFFERALLEMEASSGQAIDRGRLIAVGDSLSNDVLPVMALGAGQGVLLDRARQPMNPELHPTANGVLVVQSLAGVASLLWGP